MAGRPTAFKEEMIQQAQDYIDGGYKELEHVIPSIVGLARVLGVAKSTLYKWCEDKDHPFSDMLAYCNESQEMTLFNNGLAGTFNAAITKLVLTKHGYHDKQETEHSGNFNVNMPSNDAGTL